MDTLKNFERMMKEYSFIALATSKDNTPNVRIVTFYFCPEKTVLYFATFKQNNKVKEM